MKSIQGNSVRMDEPMIGNMTAPGYGGVITESTAEGILALKPLGQQLNVSTAVLQLGLQHLALFKKKKKKGKRKKNTAAPSLTSVAL